MSSPRLLTAVLLASALVLALAPPLAALAAVPMAAAADPVPVGEWPLQPEPEVVTGFDPPDLPWGSGHRGVDLLGHPGQEVHAALAGQVTFAGMLAGRGVVVVLHGETRTTYEPVGATVKVGEQLAPGAVLGLLEAVGSHCAPQACLHWGWLRGSTYLDPLDLIGTGRVRLLPLWREEPLPWPTPYAEVLLRLAALVARSPPGYARGCACW